jgi:acetyl-CoA carboxylase biotin carboxyl carrier protein
MDLKQIQELIKLVKKTDIGELRVKEGDFAITIKNKGFETVVSAPATYQPVAAPTTVAAPAAETQAVKTEAPKAEPKNENLITFRSPMVGTFYRKPGVDKDPFVKVGDAVNSGDTLCIIEAMKLFNEIEFDGTAGKIVKILAEDNSPVEYDQPLFLIEKA